MIKFSTIYLPRKIPKKIEFYKKITIYITGLNKIYGFDEMNVSKFLVSLLITTSLISQAVAVKPWGDDVQAGPVDASSVAPRIAGKAPAAPVEDENPIPSTQKIARPIVIEETQELMNSGKGTSPFENLSDEILLRIFDHLTSLDDFNAVLSVCMKFRRIITDRKNIERLFGVTLDKGYEDPKGAHRLFCALETLRGSYRHNKLLPQLLSLPLGELEWLHILSRHQPRLFERMEEGQATSLIDGEDSGSRNLKRLRKLYGGAGIEEAVRTPELFSTVDGDVVDILEAINLDPALLGAYKKICQLDVPDRLPNSMRAEWFRHLYNETRREPQSIVKRAPALIRDFMLDPKYLNSPFETIFLALLFDNLERVSNSGAPYFYPEQQLVERQLGISAPKTATGLSDYSNVLEGYGPRELVLMLRYDYLNPTLWEICGYRSRFPSLNSRAQHLALLSVASQHEDILPYIEPCAKFLAAQRGKGINRDWYFESLARIIQTVEDISHEDPQLRVGYAKLASLLISHIQDSESDIEWKHVMERFQFLFGKFGKLSQEQLAAILQRTGYHQEALEQRPPAEFFHLVESIDDSIESSPLKRVMIHLIKTSRWTWSAKDVKTLEVALDALSFKTIHTFMSHHQELIRGLTPTEVAQLLKALRGSVLGFKADPGSTYTLSAFRIKVLAKLAQEIPETVGSEHRIDWLLRFTDKLKIAQSHTEVFSPDRVSPENLRQINAEYEVLKGELKKMVNEGEGQQASLPQASLVTP